MIKLDAEMTWTKNFVRHLGSFEGAGHSQKPKAVRESRIVPSQWEESAWLTYINWLQVLIFKKTNTMHFTITLICIN
jgi:hypothetical protein